MDVDDRDDIDGIPNVSAPAAIVFIGLDRLRPFFFDRGPPQTNLELKDHQQAERDLTSRLHDDTAGHSQLISIATGSQHMLASACISMNASLNGQLMGYIGVDLVLKSSFQQVRASGESYFDDEIITAYLHLLWRERITGRLSLYDSEANVVDVGVAQPPIAIQRIFPVKTRFFSQMSSEQSRYVYSFDSVRNWYAGRSFFSQDVVLVPIHDASGSHWKLCVILVQDHRFIIYDSIVADDPSLANNADTIQRSVGTTSKRRREPMSISKVTY